MAKLGSDDVVIDYTMASRTMTMDLNSKEWSGRILEKLGINPEKFGRPVPSGTVAGRLPAALAEELGIKPGTLLVTGGHDQTCAALGAGVIDENTALDSHGTAEVISAALSKPKLDDLMYNSFYPCYLHAVADRYFTFALNHTGGILLKWFVENFCHEDALEAEKTGQRLYELVLSRGNTGKPSPVMVLPHFNGSGTPTCNTVAKGAILGLTMSTSRHDIARAVNEALSFELKINIETLQKAGIPINRLCCAGGGARSPIGLQSKADITGLPFSTLEIREAACLGAAMLAGIATGFWKNAGEAVQIVRTAGTYYPNQENLAAYKTRFDIYRQIYDTLTINHLIHGL
jgi:xylulokinase